MQTVTNNPFRIAGILANASEREIQRQKSKMIQYARVGRQVDSEFDFPFLSGVQRVEDTINKAFAEIQQNEDKINHSLFWFVKANPLDETAIEHLKTGNKQKALEIWGRLADSGEVSERNFSCISNIGTLKLLEGRGNKREIQEGIEAKLKLISSNYFTNYIRLVADGTCVINNQILSEKLIDILLSQFKLQYSITEIIQLFSLCDELHKKYVSQKIIGELINKMESQISNTKQKRGIDGYDCYKLGGDLYVECYKSLSIVKDVLGVNDLKYKMIADSIAKEILQCGIDYFNRWKDTSDPCKQALKLLGYADSVVVSALVKDRIRENIQGIEELAKILPIKKELDFIGQELSTFKKTTAFFSLKLMRGIVDDKNIVLDTTIADARKLVTVCKPKLDSMKNKVGKNNELYLNVSSTVAFNAQDIIVGIVNEVQKECGYNLIIDRDNTLECMINILQNAWEISVQIGFLDMNPSLEEQYMKNHDALCKIKGKLIAIKETSQIGLPSEGGNNNSGCSVLLIMGVIILLISTCLI